MNQPNYFMTFCERAAAFMLSAKPAPPSAHSGHLFLTLLFMLLTATTAWAETANVSYIDADGNSQNVTATVLTGNESSMSGWCVVNSNISYNHGITLIGELKLILADGCTMSVGSADSPLSNSHAIGIDAAVNVYDIKSHFATVSKG